MTRIRIEARIRRLAARLPGEPLDAILVTVVLALVITAAASITVSGVRVRIVAPSLDLALDTLTAVVTLAVAGLGWVRYRRRGEPVALFQTAAFLVLAIGNGLTVAVVIGGLDAQAGMALTDPGQAPLYMFTVARLLAGALLVTGGVASLRSSRIDRPVAILLGSAAAMSVAIAVIEWNAGRLPSLGTVDVTLPGAAPTPALPIPTPLGATTQVVAAALFLLASGLSRRLWRRDGSIADAYLSVGLVFAAFAQFQAALFPSAYSGLVTSGDLLRLVFDVILLLGIQAEASATLERLRLANEELARLRTVEAERAALEERARLSRELHDGLAQDLWLAKLKSRRLGALPDLGPEAATLASELDAAIDDGLAEAQQAVAAMRLAGEPPGTLGELLARSVDEFADRFGLRVEFECQGDLPALPARAQAEAFRIVQEALNNVRRHADATVVHVRACVDDGQLHLVVRDNGRGFKPEAVGASAYGLASMRERAALIGGALSIDSRPLDGTRVSLQVPLVAATSPALTRSP